jgi:hypothetical protein
MPETGGSKKKILFWNDPVIDKCNFKKTGNWEPY